MKKGLVVLGAALLVGGSTLVGTPTIHKDVSTGAYTSPVFDTADGGLPVGTYTLLEDGETIWVSTKDYFGPRRDEDTLKGLTEAHITGYVDVGTFLDVNGRSYTKEVDKPTATAIFRGEKVETKPRLQLDLASPAEAAIANTGSKTYAGRNLVTSSTTDVAIGASDTSVVYGGFNNLNALNSMSLSCGSGTVIKANAGVVALGAGNSHVWVIAGPTTGTNTCTLTATTSSFFLVQVSNYSGTLTSAAVLDAQNTGSCLTVTTCTTSLTTVTDNDWTVMYGANSVGTPGAGAGTTLRVTDSNGIGLGDSNTAVAIGSNGLTFTTGSNASFAQNIVALAPSVAAAATFNPYYFWDF